MKDSGSGQLFLACLLRIMASGFVKAELEFYGDLIYKFKKIVGRADFSDQFKKKKNYSSLQTYWI